MIGDRAAFLRQRFGTPAESVVPIEGGWVSDVLEVDGRWIFRFPKTPDVDELIRADIALLPALGEALSMPIPRPQFISEEPLCIGYPKLVGEPIDADASVTLARQLARFLSELHAFPPARVVELGIPAVDWPVRVQERSDEFRERVFPLLEPDERKRSEAMFARLDELLAEGFDAALVHGDLGPEHILVDGDRVTGVLDWSEAHVGDPALDFAWLAHGTSEVFAAALWSSYEHDVDDAFRERSLLYRRRGPWYEVRYGLDIGDERFVESGLAGIRARLP